MFSSIAFTLMSFIDIIVAAYVVLFVVGAFIWFKTERFALEVALFVLSMIVMPLIYFAMFDWDKMGALLFAPQSVALPLLACISVWGPLKRYFGVLPLIALAFVINVLGYGWTRALLFS